MKKEIIIETESEDIKNMPYKIIDEDHKVAIYGKTEGEALNTYISFLREFLL